MPSLPFPKENALAIKVIKVKQPIGEFYVGAVKAADAVLICSAAERSKTEKDGLEEYINIQRPLNPERVREIKTYVQTWDASFPNSIILAINPDCYFFEGDVLYIKKDKKSSNIIDGQHRLAGFQEQDVGGFEVILTLFPDLEFEEQAYLFSVINTKMTRINPSLAQDLYDFASINTPEKLAHDIAKTFNQEKDNPWYDKIKMLGKRELDSDAVLSQSTFTQEIINIICDKRDSYRIRHILKINNNRRIALKGFYKLDKEEKFILWKHFIAGEDKFVFTILRDYYKAIKETFPENWDDDTKILTKTTGYTAVMKVFAELYKIGFTNKDLRYTFFKNYFQQAKGSGLIKALTSDNYPPGKIGEVNLYNDVLRGMGLQK